MSTTPETPATVPPDQGERTYLFVCLGAQMVLLVVLLQRGHGSWALLPVLLGLAGLVLRWRITPYLVLFALAGLLIVPVMQQPGLRRLQGLSPARTLNDLALCGATLAFLAGHYRLHGLTSFIFPRDPRRRTVLPPRPSRPGDVGTVVRLGPVQQRRRSQTLVTAPELALLLGAVPFWAGVAHFLYPELVPGERRSTILPDEWLLHAPDEIARSAGQAASFLIEVALRSRRLIWGLGGLVLIASTVIGYLAWRRMTPDEAAVVLQDTVWTETRREERKINRWLAWRRTRWGKPS